MNDFEPHHWTHRLMTLRGTVLREISVRVFLIVLWSAAVVAFHHWVAPVSIPATLHSVAGAAVSLLLVFRTNSSYDRFWEGRKAWGGIVNETRNLARALAAFLPDRPDLRERAVLWTACFPHATMQSLRGNRGLGPVSARLPVSDVEEVESADHVPLACSIRISSVLAEARREGHLTDFMAATLDNNVQLLIGYLGVCERIHRTPIPTAYAVHLRRALILYCATLPFALVAPFEWTAVAGTLMVTFIFFGIEEIGVEIEDPFGKDDADLPLETICQTIERNLLATL